MLKRLHYILLIFCVFAILKPVLAQKDTKKVMANINWPTFLAQYDMVWTKMPLNYYEGPFVGNGLMGTVFFKDTTLPNTIGFEIGRTDIYDHRTSEQIKDKYPSPKVRLPIGKLLLSCRGSIQSVYFKTSLWDAVVTGTITTNKGKIELQCYAPSDEKFIVLNYQGFSDEANATVSFRPEQGNSARPPRRPMAGKEYEPNPPFTVRKQNDIEIITQSLLNGDDYATAWNDVLTNNNEHSVYITVANKWAENIRPYNGSDALAIQQLQEARKKNPLQMMQHHTHWWHKYYPKSFIEIPDKRLQSFYWLQQYRLASAGRPDKAPIDLMGPWYKPSVWLAMWVNLNIQLAYYTTAITNHLDLEEPYFKMIEQYQQQLIQAVPKEFQNDCAAMANPVIFNDLSGSVFLTADSSSKKKMNLIALPWIMQQFYLHYRYDMDEKRLRNSIYPLMRRAFNVYARIAYKSSDGKYHLPLTFSDEYGEDYDVSMNLALAKWGLKTLIQTSEQLKIKEPLLPKWKDLVTNLTAYPTDTTGIKLGRNQAFSKPHRHYSHLFCIFPLYEMNVDENVDKLPLMQQSIKYFTSLEGDNCMFKFTGASSLWAALGNGNEALNWLQRAVQVLSYKVPTVTPNGFYSENGWPTFESPISATRNILDMQLQSWGNKIRIFPAMPDEWKEASFHQLRAEGGFTVSAQRINGKTNWVSIMSLADEPCIVEVKDWKGEVFSSDKTIQVEKIKDGLYKIYLKKNQSTTLYISSQQTSFQIIPNYQNEFHWGLN
jgi:hypothetical protein